MNKRLKDAIQAVLSHPGFDDADSDFGATLDELRDAYEESLPASDESTGHSIGQSIGQTPSVADREQSQNDCHGALAASREVKGDKL